MHVFEVSSPLQLILRHKLSNQSENAYVSGRVYIPSVSPKNLLRGKRTGDSEEYQ